MWGSRVKIFEKLSSLTFAVSVNIFDIFMCCLELLNQVRILCEKKNWKIRIGKCYTNVYVLLPGRRKILPRVDMLAEKWNKIDLIFIEWSSTLLYELLYFHFVNVCNAKSWNCLTKMIKKIRKRMSPFQKIDLAKIGQTLLRNQSIGKNGQNWTKQKLPRFNKTWT